MVQLTHFHDDTLAAHSADEFENLEAGSGKALAMERLNNFVAEQKELEEEVAEEEEAEGTETATEETEEEHEHGELVHYALDTTGRMYFFEEHEDGLEEMQGFVQLDNVSSIMDCSRTTIARVSEEGVLVFIPDTQLLYLVDAHGGDFHQHSTWPVSALLPENETTDLVALIGSGEEHDHDHEEE
ncbi:hypothetical protein GQR58_027371 [Nymphon striatum]|nr:hypothetical protein GQR58_027371 [Nymphon striatum]